VFSWDAAKAARNLEKHGVGFEEAATVFQDAAALDWPAKLVRWRALVCRNPFQETWQSGRGRTLLVVYTIRRLKRDKETIRIISARQASRRERKAYAGQSH
jgi:hypothetical protein